MQTTTIHIQGMTCQGCVNSINTVLRKLPNVYHVEVSLDSGHATIQHDPTQTSVDQLKAAIEEAGFEAVE